MSTKTTHEFKGSCQVCCRVQAVDNKTGLLAKHGYNVEWGFFSGVCYGANNLPYEKSKNLIEAAIKQAIAQRAKHVELAIDERLSNDPKVWVLRADNTKRSRPERWIEIVLGVDEYRRDKWTTEEDHQARLKTSICSYHEKRAKMHDKIIEELDRYVAYQQRRILDWEIQPLLKADSFGCQHDYQPIRPGVHNIRRCTKCNRKATRRVW